MRIPAKGHDWGDWIVDKQATDQTDGAQHRICKVCGERQDAAIQKLDHVHNHIPTVIDPTCEQQGYTRYTCACGDMCPRSATHGLRLHGRSRPARPSA